MFRVKIDNIIIETEKTNLLDLLHKNEFFVVTPCGGHGKCGKCTVYVNGEKRLACNTLVTCDMTVTIPSVQGGAIETAGRMRTGVKHTENGFGLAFDIGTTTVCGYLVDLSDGSIIRCESALNLQASYGADVISRIEYCMKNSENELCGIINSQIDDMSEKLAEGFEIKRTVIAANTVMSHIYMNSDVSGLARAPFVPSFLEAQKKGNTTLMPCISAYIGSDITASMLSCNTDTEKRTVILLDLGTNGEIVLHHDGVLYCCSTSAGPALEGAGISCGTGSIDGAVYRFEFINKIPSVTTINKKPPIGICGSGLVDIIASFLDNNIINEYGTFISNPDFNRYMSDDKFMISGGISVSQQDIRKFQTVKSAIFSGIIMLMQKAGVCADEIDEVYMCGGLGSNINIQSACRTGLLPGEFMNRATLCGNTSGLGAVAVLCDPTIIDEGENLRRRAVIVELGNEAGFEKLFIENMNFVK